MLKKYRHILFALLAIAALCWLSPPLAGQENSIGQIGAAEQRTEQQAQQSMTDSGGHSEEGHEGHAHHGPPVELFGRQFGDTGQFFIKLANFLIFAGLLIFILKGTLSSVFKARASEIEAKLAQSEKDRAEGEAQMRELEAKMSGLQQELSGIMAQAESDAEAEKQRILEAAKSEAEQLLAQAQSEIDYQKRLAETELRELVAKLAVEGAEGRLRQQAQGDSAARIMDQAIQQIGGAN